MMSVSKHSGFRCARTGMANQPWRTDPDHYFRSSDFSLRGRPPGFSRGLRPMSTKPIFALSKSKWQRIASGSWSPKISAVEKLISIQSKSKQDVEPQSGSDCGSDWSPTLSHSLSGDPRYHSSSANGMSFGAGGNTVLDGDRDHHTNIPVSQVLLPKGRAEHSELAVNK